MTTPQPMIVGLNCQQSDYATHLRIGSPFARARVARVFSRPGEGIIPWTDARLAGLPARLAPHTSFKDWDSDAAAAAQIRRHLDTMPQRLRDAPLLPEVGYSCAITHEHEPEDNRGLIPVEYQRRTRILYQEVREHRYGDYVAVVPVQNLQWTLARSGPDGPKGDGNVFAWWAGVGDFAGIDCYANSWDADYPKPVDFLAMPLRLAAGTGRRLWIPELGAVRLANDPTGTRRAAWISQVVTLLRAAGCVAVSWWCAMGTGGKDIHLSDQPGANVWRAALSTGPPAR